MTEIEVSNEIMNVKSREQMIRFLDGYSADRLEDLDERKNRAPLVKSYMLEHAGDSRNLSTVSNIMSERGILSTPIDDNLSKLQEPGKNLFMGFLETLTPRYFVFYSIHESQLIDRWIRKLVASTSALDHVWLSGVTFNVLWNKVVQLNRPNRYARIMFQHDSIYQIDKEMESPDEPEEDDENTIINMGDEDDNHEILERRASKFTLVDKISVVHEKLKCLQDIYFPLYAISQLRFPSPVGRGGHDFYDYGKVTNRSGDFRDHRNHILYIQHIYDSLMKKTEEKIWFSIEKETVKTLGEFQNVIGSPLTIKFKEPLNKETFDYWIASTFGRTRNRFRLWGNPIRLGSKKVHVYGVDRHLWQPIFMEFTDKHLMAIIPKGTCGNTVHRLVTNIQRFIDPAADVYVGDMKYNDMIGESSAKVKYESSN
ncbi:MAG: hypothetical protein ACM3SY_13300 [Candidatus Omnitrophota bacterium]